MISPNKYDTSLNGLKSKLILFNIKKGRRASKISILLEIDLRRAIEIAIKRRQKIAAKCVPNPKRGGVTAWRSKFTTTT